MAKCIIDGLYKLTDVDAKGDCKVEWRCCPAIKKAAASKRNNCPFIPVLESNAVYQNNRRNLLLLSADYGRFRNCIMLPPGVQRVAKAFMQ